MKLIIYKFTQLKCISWVHQSDVFLFLVYKQIFPLFKTRKSLQLDYSFDVNYFGKLIFSQVFCRRNSRLKRDYGYHVLVRQSQSHQLYMIPCGAKGFVNQVCWYSFNISLVFLGEDLIL